MCCLVLSVARWLLLFEVGWCSLFVVCSLSVLVDCCSLFVYMVVVCCVMVGVLCVLLVVLGSVLVACGSFAVGSCLCFARLLLARVC